MGLIQSDSNNAFQQLAERLTAARAAALDQLTATRMGLIDNLSRLNGRLIPTQYQSSGATEYLTTTIAADTWSGWQTMIGSTNFAVTTCVFLCSNVLGSPAEIQIGEGASGSEVVRAHIAVAENGWFATRFRVNIASGSRVSLRYRGRGAAAPASRSLQILLGG